jgi:hypothetical protein
MTIVWAYYYKNIALLRTRTKLNIINAKDTLTPEETINLPPPVAPSPPASNAVPWMEILNKPAFW